MLSFFVLYSCEIYWIGPTFAGEPLLLLNHFFVLELCVLIALLIALGFTSIIFTYEANSGFNFCISVVIVYGTDLYFNSTDGGS